MFEETRNLVGSSYLERGAMDIQRTGIVKRKLIRRAIFLVAAAAVAMAANWRMGQFKPAAPVVEMASIWADTVKRGPLVREVRGLGTLVPENILWIQAAFDAQVKTVAAQSGDAVGPGSVLVALSNPQMEADADESFWQVKQAEADYTGLKVRLESQTLDQQVLAATAAGDLKQAEINREKEEQLFAMKLGPEINVKLAEAKWQQAASRARMEQRKLEIMRDSIDAQLDSQRVQIEKLRAAHALKKRQVDELTIRAVIRGRVQELTLEIGQRVKAGDILAKVAQPRKLMARLQIAETQAKDVALGQRASIDTRNGIVKGHVARIDASVVNGARIVDCKLDGALPEGAVPDLSVDGTIEFERIENAVYVGRPAFAQPGAVASLFRLDATGNNAERVAVRFGRTSANAIEIVEGLREGERVILSDMAAQDGYEKVRLR